jgi:PEP-CTERM motif-containing protein
MRALFLLAATLTVAANVLGQGVIIFVNSGSPDAPIRNGVTGDLLSGTAFQVQLYGFQANASESSLLALKTPTTFFTGLLAGYFNGGKVTNSYVLPGEVGTFQVRAWSSPYSSYEEALLYADGNPNVLLGKSDVFQAQTGASSGSGLIGLQSFTIDPIPEPSSLALLGAGAAIIFLWRRNSYTTR